MGARVIEAKNIDPDKKKTLQENSSAKSDAIASGNNITKKKNAMTYNIGGKSYDISTDEGKAAALAAAKEYDSQMPPNPYGVSTTSALTGTIGVVDPGYFNRQKAEKEAQEPKVASNDNGSQSTIGQPNDDVQTSINELKGIDERLMRPHFMGGTMHDPTLPFDADEARETKSGIDMEGHDMTNDTTTGVPSLMNTFSFSTFHGVGHFDKDLLYDVEGKRKWYDMTKNVRGKDGAAYDYRDPSVENLIDFFGDYDESKLQDGVVCTPYSYSDFAYCKYFGRIPNNRLITLRRYTCPVFDNLRMPDWEVENTKNPENRRLGNNKFYPLAQAVTWIGKECGNELSSMMNFSTNLPWEKIDSNALKVQSDDMSDTTTARVGSSLRSAFKAISILTGEADLSKAKYNHHQFNDPYEGGPYSNRVLGPVNCIKGTMKRAQGLEFAQEFQLTFKYTARALGGVNGKAALLEIMSNFLVMCYGVGAFWGGMNRWDGRVIAFPWKEGMRAWYSGEPIKMFKACQNAMAKIGNKLEGMLKDMAANPVEALKNLAGDALQMGAGALFQQLGSSPQNAPQVRALLTGEPVGEWHLTVGNPFAPILRIGNLICEKCDFEWGNELGPDDFPLDLTVKVTLKPGMSRDRHMVESMYNQGWGRIYTIPTSIETTSAAQESKVDANTGPGSRKTGGKGERLRGQKYFDAFFFELGKTRKSQENLQSQVYEAGAGVRDKVAAHGGFVQTMLDGNSKLKDAARKDYNKGKNS